LYRFAFINDIEPIRDMSNLNENTDYLAFYHDFGIAYAEECVAGAREGVPVRGDALDFVIDFFARYVMELIATVFLEPGNDFASAGIKATGQQVTWLENAIILLGVLCQIERGERVAREDLAYARHVIDAINEDPLIYIKRA